MSCRGNNRLTGKYYSIKFFHETYSVHATNFVIVLCPYTFIRRTTGPKRRSTKGNWTTEEVCHT
jgi:hypothetical protein